MKWTIGQWVDVKDSMEKWYEGIIIDKRPYAKSAGHFLDDPSSDSDNEDIDSKYELHV